MALPVLSVIGLGKLGSPFAAVMAAKGFHVIGVDKNPVYVKAINAGKAPVEEPLLQAFINRGRARLDATHDSTEATLGSDISFLIVPTPSGADGTFSNKFILDAIKPIAKAAAQKKSPHIIVVTSTVMPHAGDGIIRQTIEKYSGKQVGTDIGYCYNPEFIALGSVIQDMLEPDFILIGESDTRSGRAVAACYQQVCGKDVSVQRMNIVNAEITKIAINTYVTTKISYANMLADVCERLAGADVDVVCNAVGSDSRIGRKYLKGAAAYGGPCFPRDNIAFSQMARKLGARADLPRGTDKLNNFQTDRLFRKIKNVFPTGAHIGIAGMAYKPDTPVIERAAGMALAEKLLKAKYKVSIYDPWAAKNAKAALHHKVRVAGHMNALARSVDGVVLMLPHKDFALSPTALHKRKRALWVLDCWRLLDAKKFGKKAEIIYVGKAS